MKCDAVILDLDGTLVDSSGEIHAAINRAFAEEGLATMTRDDVEALVGRGVRALVERALPKVGGGAKDLDFMVDRFEHHYAQVIGTDATLCPGARPGLEKLLAAGMPMSVVTNKPRSFTQRLLERLDILRYLKGFVAGDDGFPKKPAGDMVTAACRMLGAEPARSIMI
ncbi:MAG: HAD family hydrolase, partial [Bacillota bacterium]